MQHVLVIGFVWPEPNSSAAGNRMLQLISVFLEQGWKVTFATSCSDSEFMFDLGSIGVDKAIIRLNDPGFDTFIRELQPDIVLFDRFMIEEQYGWRVAEHCPEALRVLDTEDLHCLRQARQQAWKEKRQFKSADLYSDTAKREIASILRCDISLIISEFEMALLQQEFRIDPALLHYFPLLAEPIDAAVTQHWPTFADRKHFGFIGNFLHEPNWNAVQYLKESIWPLIRRELPEAEVHIYGAYPSQKVWQLHKPEQGFQVLGRAADAQAVMCDMRICLAPLRFGAGIKGKLLEAMCCGTPSVTTSIGAEGMHGALPWNGSIADAAETIAAEAVSLYRDEVRWKAAQHAGISIVNTRHVQALFAGLLCEQILDMQQRLSAHRQRNFMGALLMHHTLASTKYMSRWIEEKQRKS
jgi:hypothetical protein